MDVYVLIEEYPGSPSLGFELTDERADYYRLQPSRYPKFWAKREEPKSIVTKDGFKVLKGEMIYLLDDFTYEITEVKLNDLSLPLNKIAFYERKAASKYRDSLIRFSLPECGEVVGKIPMFVYDPVTKERYETSSDKVFEIIRFGVTALKFFKTEVDREVYILETANVLSVKDIMECAIGVIKGSGSLEGYFEEILTSLMEIINNKLSDSLNGLENELKIKIANKFNDNLSKLLKDHL